MKTKLAIILATLGLMVSVVAFAGDGKTAAAGCTTSQSALASSETEPVVMFANQTSPSLAIQYAQAVNQRDLEAYRAEKFITLHLQAVISQALIQRQVKQR